MTNNSFYKEIKKICKKEGKNNKDKFHPTCVSVRKMCNQIGKPEYFTQIRNRIYRTLENEEEVKYLIGEIYFDINDLEDLSLDRYDIIDYFEILVGYFGEEYIKGLRKFLYREDEYKKLIYDFRESLKALDKETLKGAEKLYISHRTQEYNPILEEFIQLIKQEKRRRKLIKIGTKKR